MRRDEAKFGCTAGGDFNVDQYVVAHLLLGLQSLPPLRGFVLQQVLQQEDRVAQVWPRRTGTRLQPVLQQTDWQVGPPRSLSLVSHGKWGLQSVREWKIKERQPRRPICWCFLLFLLFFYFQLFCLVFMIVFVSLPRDVFLIFI